MDFGWGDQIFGQDVPAQQQQEDEAAQMQEFGAMEVEDEDDLLESDLELHRTDSQLARLLQEAVGGARLLLFFLPLSNKKRSANN